MPCLVRLAVMTLAVMSPTYIQSQEPRASTPDRGFEREVVRKLESADPATVAWGAYEAGARHLTQTIPALQRIVERRLSQDDRQRRALLAVVLDALLQLHASLPASLLVRSAVGHPVQSFALLANAKDREPALRLCSPKPMDSGGTRQRTCSLKTGLRHSRRTSFRPCISV